MPSQIILFAFGIVILFFGFTYFVPLNLWITAIFSGVSIDLSQLVFMRIRKSPVKDIVFSMITCHKAGVGVTIEQLETYSLASGNVQDLTKALITAKNENIEIPFDEFQAMGLAGHDLLIFIKERKSDSQTGIGDIKRNLCKHIINDFNDDQIRKLELYMNTL